MACVDVQSHLQDLFKHHLLVGIIACLAVTCLSVTCLSVTYDIEEL